MGAHVDRHAVYENREIGAVIEIVAAQEVYDNSGTASGTIYFDPDGGNSSNAISFAKITAGGTLLASDFHLGRIPMRRLAIFAGPEGTAWGARQESAKGLNLGDWLSANHKFRP